MHLSLAALLVVRRRPGSPAMLANRPRRPITSQTVAERSDFHATSRYDEVNAFLKDLAAVVRWCSSPTSARPAKDRAIPLALIADPPVATAEEARQSGKLIVLLLGGIHSGECDGKEALLALARDIALAQGRGEKARKEDEEEGRMAMPAGARSIVVSTP